MKNLLIAFVLLSSLTSCLTASKKARNESLMPAARLAWGTVEYGVQSDVLRGIQDAVDDGDLVDGTAYFGAVDDMTEALRAESRTALYLVAWDQIQPYVERGINDRVEDGEMVEQAAVFLRRRATEFAQSIATLTNRSYAWSVYDVSPDRGVTVPSNRGRTALVSIR